MVHSTNRRKIFVKEFGMIKYIFFGKNAMFFPVFETEKRHGKSCLLKSHFSVNKECQNDTNDTCNGKADGQTELQCQHTQIQHDRGGQTKIAAIIQPAQYGNTT